MIEIKTGNENKEGYELQIKLHGVKMLLVDELIGVFDGIYRNAPDVFEKALLLSKYTKDHT